MVEATVTEPDSMESITTKRSGTFAVLAICVRNVRRKKASKFSSSNADTSSTANVSRDGTATA
jgi:hypothetical protein